MNLFEIEPSTAAASVAGCRSRLDAAEKAAIDSAGEDSDLVAIYQQLALDGDGSAAKAELYFLEVDYRTAAEIADHMSVIESAWHALQQAERRALRTLKQP